MRHDIRDNRLYPYRRWNPDEAESRVKAFLHAHVRKQWVAFYQEEGGASDAQIERMTTQVLDAVFPTIWGILQEEDATSGQQVQHKPVLDMDAMINLVIDKIQSTGGLERLAAEFVRK